MKPLYNKFGILNLFSMSRLNGSYRLDLSVHEERVVAKIFIELAKIEGLDKIIYFHLNGKSISKVTKEFLDKMNF